ncbi:MAG TPA: hypothetical protein DCM38_11225, partial [Gammaproteobacteria bacterium]|nr:hypothetical protein [Gammaproteobacteria bacterium]
KRVILINPEGAIFKPNLFCLCARFSNPIYFATPKINNAPFFRNAPQIIIKYQGYQCLDK